MHDLVKGALRVEVREEPDTDGIEPSTGISRAHISGTLPRPIRRAASAGNAERRSSVTVNSTLTRSSCSMSLRSRTDASSRSVASKHDLGLVAIDDDGPTGGTDPHPRSLPGSGRPGATRLHVGDRARARISSGVSSRSSPGGRSPSFTGPIRSAHQADHRESHLGQQAPDLALAPLRS